MIKPIYGQLDGQLGQESWSKVTHQVKQLTVVDQNKADIIKSIILNSGASEYTEKYSKSKYFHLYVTNDSICKLNFRLSKVPYKAHSIIGCYTMGNYVVFVHNELPDYLSTTSMPSAVKFTYPVRKLGDYVYIGEDDAPYWLFYYDKDNIELKDSSFK